MCQKCGRKNSLWVLHEIVNKTYAESMKKSWMPFGSYLLNSAANSAQFQWKWAGLELPNGTHDFFHIFSICFINYFMKNPQTTFVPTFLTHIIARIDGVDTLFLTHIIARIDGVDTLFLTI